MIDSMVVMGYSQEEGRVVWQTMWRAGHGRQGGKRKPNGGEVFQLADDIGLPTAEAVDSCSSTGETRVVTTKESGSISFCGNDVRCAGPGIE